MMKSRISTGCSSLTLLLLMVQLAMAGTVIEQQVKERDERPTQVILYFSGSQLRTDHPESGMATILDFKNDQIVLIDHRSKNYLSMKLSQWEKQTAMQLKKGNPAGQPKERVITVRSLGEIAMVNGYKTEKVQVLADGEVIEEHSMTKDIDMNEVDRIMEMAAQGLSTEVRSQLKEGREIHRKLKPYGFSIRVRDYTISQNTGGVDTLEVKKIERKELKPEVFQPPASYQKITPPPVKK